MGVRGKWECEGNGSEREMGVRVRKREGGRKLEGGDWQRGKGAPHLACALGHAAWGSGPAPHNQHMRPTCAVFL